jgi:CHAT domain-containing protein
LIHYSGHTSFDGQQSAWHLQDGKITTDLLTSALQNAPPAMVFSSSCESGAGAEVQPVAYENQTFDLPTAFLQAGVGAYVGTLWEVGAEGARLFVQGFYNAFLSGQSLGRCLQQAKIGIPGNRYRTDRLAFILYGDPHTEPADLFPALAKED